MNEGATIRLRSLGVDLLFGRFNYDIPLSFPLGILPGLVIITAPNGYGKSTILKLLNDVGHGEYVGVAKTNFRILRIETEEGYSLRITQTCVTETATLASETGFRLVQLLFELLDEGASVPIESWEAEISLPDEEEEYEQRGFPLTPSAIDKEFPSLRRIAPAQWKDIRSGQIFSISEIIRKHETRHRQERRYSESEPAWLTEFRGRLQIIYISANRLRADSEARQGFRPRNVDMVEVWADRLGEIIRNTIRKYAENGRKLEQAFPGRIIEALRSQTTATQHEVAQLVDRIRESERRYQTLGLLSAGQTSEIDRGLEDRCALVALRAYLEDIEEKFVALEETAVRLELFFETINSMLLFKRLKLSADSGFEVIGNSNRLIPRKALSSGEQHLIVLLGELVFASKGGATILLDEPEISFHPEWQERFPKLLNKIIEVNGCLIVMATHSPTLIQDSWESVVELADQVGQ